jgi:hypothetical protein
MYHKTPPGRERYCCSLRTTRKTSKKSGERVTDQYRREQIAFPNQRTTYFQEPRPARKIPTREQILAAARRQAALEANVDVENDYDLEEGDEYYQSRLPTSSRRYQVSPEEVYQNGNTRLHVRYVDVPKRKSRQPQLPPERKRQTEEYAAVPPSTRQGRRLHPLVWFGIFGVFLVLGWFGLNAVTSWYQGVQNDLTYGKQRHFEINAVVGHSDSANNPSHFTAENNNGQIIVFELPGNNVSKAKIYQIETVPGNAGNPPVKLSFQDMNGDGRLDMLVQIGDNSATLYVTLFNNGIEFVSKL